MTNCNHKTWILASVLSFALAVGFDYLVHGVLLMDMYLATASLWRPEEQMQELGYLCMIGTAVMVALIAGAYKCWRSKVTCDTTSGKPLCCKALGFGSVVGLVIGIMSAKSYVWLAIPQELALAWLVAEVVKWSLIAMLLEVIYSKTKA